VAETDTQLTFLHNPLGKKRVLINSIFLGTIAAPAIEQQPCWLSRYPKLVLRDTAIPEAKELQRQKLRPI